MDLAYLSSHVSGCDDSKLSLRHGCAYGFFIEGLDLHPRDVQISLKLGLPLGVDLWPISVALADSVLAHFAHANNELDLFLHYHPPEVASGGLERTLTRDDLRIACPSLGERRVNIVCVDVRICVDCLCLNPMIPEDNTRVIIGDHVNVTV